MASVTSEQVAEYLPLVERYAHRLTGFAGAEYDDLRQEGMIAVDQAIRRGLRPSALVVGGRMIDWIRFLRRLMHNDGVAYDVWMPIEDFPDV